MNRRAFVEHVAWTGAGILYALGADGTMTAVARADAAVDFVQISDSHIGFRGAANSDVAGSLKAAVDAINALPNQPAFVVHTGDVTHLATPEQFRTAHDLLSALRAPLIALPGEHDMLGRTRRFFDVFPAGSAQMWRSWENGGIHYIALVNVFGFEKMGILGNDQLAWLERDLRGLRASMPVVVFAHVPLYALYPQWGWTTEDGAKALALLRRFERVTVLNGHIHQVVRHREGNITFASANATAYPQPAPGTAPHPGPLALPREALLHAIGYRTVELSGDGRAVIGDEPLA